MISTQGKVHKKVVLHAGEYCFAKAGTAIHTLLGSCVSICLWHPTMKIGGMCHFALPKNNSLDETHKNKKLNPRFASDCIALFARSIKKHNTSFSEYEAKIFGGGDMYHKHHLPELGIEQKQAIGNKNVQAAYELLMQENANILVAHVGEFGYRKIVQDLNTGDVWVKYVPVKHLKGDVRSLSEKT